MAYGLKACSCHPLNHWFLFKKINWFKSGSGHPVKIKVKNMRRDSETQDPPVTTSKE